MKKKRKKRYWMRKIFQEREEKSLLTTLVKDLQLFDREYFFKNFRMDTRTFEDLLSWIAPIIQKSSLRRSTATPAERLSVTLRYLATGDSQTTIGTSYRIRPTTMGRIISETCQTLWRVLSEKGFIKAPDSEEEWLAIAAEFNDKWNFPHCFGAIDGKHVLIQAPARSGSNFFNYKKCFSIVLLAVCNANYEFTLLDIGEAGRQSDGGVYSSSNLGQAIDQNILKFSKPATINNYSTTKKFPYVFVAGEAFALKPFMLRPYPRRNELNIHELIFNYRLSRARRLIENTFGILASRFRIFRRPIIAKIENIKHITKAAVILHNFLMRRKERGTYCPPDYVDQETAQETLPGRWRVEVNGVQGLTVLGIQGSNNLFRIAKEVRNDFKDLFNSPQGEVSWQNHVVQSTSDPFDENS